MTGNVHYELLGIGQTVTEYKKFIANNSSVSVMYDIINEYEEKWCHLLWIGNTSVSRTNPVSDGYVASFSIFSRFSDNLFFRLLGHFIGNRIRRYKKMASLPDSFSSKTSELISGKEVQNNFICCFLKLPMVLLINTT